MFYIKPNQTGFGASLSRKAGLMSRIISGERVKEAVIMIMTVNGVSTTKNKDQFQCEKFYSDIVRSYRYQWDYRDAAGELHSGITKTEEAAIENAKKYGYQA